MHILYDNNVAAEIYEEFNSAIFLNKKNFMEAVGEKSYQYIMKYYIELTIRKMEMQTPYLLEWVSGKWFWSDVIVGYFDKEINRERINFLGGVSSNVVLKIILPDLD